MNVTLFGNRVFTVVDHLGLREGPKSNGRCSSKGQKRSLEGAARSLQKLQVKPGTGSPSEPPEGISLLTPPFWTLGLVVAHAAITSYHRAGGLTDRNVFSLSPGSWKRDVRRPAWPGFGEGPLPDSGPTTFPLGPHRAASAGGRASISLSEALLPL